ncbi:hypothetical protein [Leptospira stimsonii]|uniref:hypothetical protein n=1 Tax=Leptospira stimsonii TaxID=2202203 RepID=UPI0010839CDC|nr:hypothetical protein [Leptospira stimsonii]TGK18854.1 hypothetical protein EHO98_12135 [Leptospira stimsonii]
MDKFIDSLGNFLERFFDPIAIRYIISFIFFHKEAFYFLITNHYEPVENLLYFKTHLNYIPCWGKGFFSYYVPPLVISLAWLFAFPYIKNWIYYYLESLKVEGINKINQAKLKIKHGFFTLEEIENEWSSKMHALSEKYNMIHNDTIIGLKQRLNITGDVAIMRVGVDLRVGDWIIGDVNGSAATAIVSNFPDLSKEGSYENFNFPSKIFGLVIEKYENGLGAVQTNGEVGNYYTDLASLSDSNKKEIYLSVYANGKAVNLQETDSRKVSVQIGSIEDSFLKINPRVAHSEVGRREFE